MITKLGYPKSHLGVEVSLKSIADENFVSSEIPLRRVDVVCFDSKHLKPLLLIECKAQTVTEKAFRQLQSYNHFVKAPFIALVTVNRLYMGFYEKKENRYSFEEGLKSFQELTQAVSGV